MKYLLFVVMGMTGLATLHAMSQAASDAHARELIQPLKIGAGADWVKRYAGSAPWATSKTLRERIGPNGMPE